MKLFLISTNPGIRHETEPLRSAKQAVFGENRVTPVCRVGPCLGPSVQGCKMPAEVGSVSLLQYVAASSRARRCLVCVAPRRPNANAAAYLHVLACIILANVQHFEKRCWPVVARSPSKYDNSARWSWEESCVWERDRGWRQTLRTSLHLFITSLLIWFPTMPFSAIIADAITAACGAELHLEVRIVLCCIKNKFARPNPLVRAGISQVGGCS